VAFKTFFKNSTILHKTEQKSLFLYDYMCTNMTRLSVNINKIATIRNARGGNMPDVEKAAID